MTPAAQGLAADELENARLKIRLSDATTATITYNRVNMPDTVDEIVTLTNRGGRAVFQNAGRTQRNGVEIAAMKSLGAGFTANAAHTWLNASYRDGFFTCLTTPCAVPNVAVAAGNSIPGVPKQSVYLELIWRAPRNAASPFFSNPYAALELRRVSQIYVDDRNSDAASGYTLVNLRAGVEQRSGKWTISEFFRIDNLANQRYAGSVIVNETNGRFFEPAPGRTWTAGVSAALRFE